MDPENLSFDDANIYNKLPDNDWFRVLFIMPGEFNLPVICRLKKFRREDIIGQYEALSYSWTEKYSYTQQESAPDFCKIECNRAEVSVHQSLGMALRYLRKPVSHRAMWIDRLCINQDDPEERFQQVQVMSRIYN
jgi:hypothetical protein